MLEISSVMKIRSQIILGLIKEGKAIRGVYSLEEMMRSIHQDEQHIVVDDSRLNYNALHIINKMKEIISLERRVLLLPK